MGADGALQSIKGLHGNTLTVTAAGIISSTGLSVPFGRDGYNRIAWIADALGNWYGPLYFPATSIRAAITSRNPA